MEGRDDILKPHQRLLFHIMDLIKSSNYRCYRGSIHRQIKVTDPTNGQVYETRAWEPIMNYEEFIKYNTRKEEHFELWLVTTDIGWVKRCVQYLCYSEEENRDRHIFSFVNGIFNAKDISFRKFQPDVSIPTDITAIQFFNLEFPYEWIDKIVNKDGQSSWWDIPTPHLQDILENQNMGKGSSTDKKSERRKVMKWLYRFIGRLLFDVGEMDSWMMTPFIRGVNDSGDYNIFRLCSNFYPMDHVALINSSYSDVDRKYPLLNIMNSKLGISAYPKSQLSLSKLLEVDNNNSSNNKRTVWNTPHIFFGNELSSWMDYYGRNNTSKIITWHFLRKINNPNPRLDEELKKEMGHIILKTSIAYVVAATKYGHRNIWDLLCLPRYFRDTNRKLCMQMDPFLCFIEDTDLFEIGARDFDGERDPIDLNLTSPRYILKDDLRKMFKNYLVDNNLSTKIIFNEDLYRSIFYNYNIKEESHGYRYYNGSMKNGTYFVGIGRKMDVFNTDRDYDYVAYKEREKRREKHEVFTSTMYFE